MQKVIMTSKHHTMPVAPDTEGVLVCSDKKHNFVYWPTEDKISRHLHGKSIETQKFGFLEHNEKLVAKRALERYKAENAEKIKAKKSNGATTAKLGTATNALDILNTEMGAVSAVMNGGDYNKLQKAVIIKNVAKIVERCRVQLGLTELMLLGDGIDEAENTINSAKELYSQLQDLGVESPDTLLNL